jgi:glycosyltransferase involved in cell wall biosynthesis
MNILWLTWKDIRHPEAGGAEVVAYELTTRLLRAGHSVTMLTCGYEGASGMGWPEGLHIIRVGTSRYLHPFQALAYYARHLRGKFDILIEEVNGAAPYFSVLLERKTKKFLLYHQLGRKNWLHEVPRPLSYVGYWLLAPLATRVAGLSGAPVITVSDSTRQVLARHGMPAKHTSIISEGLANEPLASLDGIKKFDKPTVLSLGAMRAMKRTLDHIKAFELAKKQMPELQMKLAGGAGNAYGQKVLRYAQQSPYAADIEYVGRPSDDEKLRLMQRAHIILQTAVEEGWGLTITEAASQGAPAVAYDVDGLRDSIRHGKTGILTAPKPSALASGIIQILSDREDYERQRRAAWDWSKQITFDQSFKDFSQIVGLV